MDTILFSDVSNTDQHAVDIHRRGSAINLAFAVVCAPILVPASVTKSLYSSRDLRDNEYNRKYDLHNAAAADDDNEIYCTESSDVSTVLSLIGDSETNVKINGK